MVAQKADFKQLQYAHQGSKTVLHRTHDDSFVHQQSCLSFSTSIFQMETWR